MRERDVEALARREARERLSAWQLLRLYLDPFSLFKNVTAGRPTDQVEALRYNRRQRGMLLAYARRWAIIGAACLTSMLALASHARAEPVLCVPIVGLELGFTTAVCALLLCFSVYLVLGLD